MLTITQTTVVCLLPLATAGRAHLVKPRLFLTTEFSFRNHLMHPEPELYKPLKGINAHLKFRLMTIYAICGQVVIITRIGRVPMLEVLVNELHLDAMLCM